MTPPPCTLALHPSDWEVPEGMARMSGCEVSGLLSSFHEAMFTGVIQFITDRSKIRSWEIHSLSYLNFSLVICLYRKTFYFMYILSPDFFFYKNDWLYKKVERIFMWASVHLELTFAVSTLLTFAPSLPLHTCSLFTLMPPCVPRCSTMCKRFTTGPLLFLLFLLRYNLDTVRCIYIKWTISEILRCKYLCNPIPVQIQNIKSPQKHPPCPVNLCPSQSPR